MLSASRLPPRSAPRRPSVLADLKLPDWQTQLEPWVRLPPDRDLEAQGLEEWMCTVVDEDGRKWMVFRMRRVGR